jgi:uncharacterized linocin/CFP29 family protein
MVTDFLSRDDAPIGAELWALLDDIMVREARGQLSVRRLLEIEGPYGFGLKSVPLDDGEEVDGVITSSCLPLALLTSSFVLGKRDLAAYEYSGVFPNLNKLAEAAREAARKEDDLLLNGGAGAQGLMDYPGVGKNGLGDWSTTGTAAADLIEAVTALDEAGFHGPYVLGLSPRRYNQLFYSETCWTAYQLISQIVESIVKLPGLKEGGVLVAEGRQYASIIVGQDLSLGFIGPTRDGLEFSLSESLALLVREPRAIHVLG